MKTMTVGDRPSRSVSRAEPRLAPRDATASSVGRVLLFCGILSPAIYFATDLIAARAYPGFSYANQAVSELFAIGAPTSGFVVAFFTVSSALLLLFAAGVWRSAGKSRALRGMAVMLALSAIDGLILWNAFPMHMRGEATTMTDTMHLVFATNPFVLLSLVFGAAAFRNWFRDYTFATLVVILGLALYGFSYASAVAANDPTPLMGLSERAGQSVYGLWQMLLAVILLRGTGRGERRA